ncbi:fibrinogen C domain-containing protein 1-A-like [Drosophila sulfurigaster albostrigata]|uniref:fibrinogen C domain-containing protein 1-A-like n=1 Tax=Drosophila sulfurigaster albostrigata TaxID=89887 RepID=UPI002D21D400|nr:fibrinogen C domain-containing protein 1-A-like [Drosophila sulfurigaster albostrigata]
MSIHVDLCGDLHFTNILNLNLIRTRLVPFYAGSSAVVKIKMNRIINDIFLILLVQQFSSAATVVEETCELNREMGKQCGSMLDYFRQMKDEFQESVTKDIIIKDLREKLVQQEVNEALIKQLRSQIDYQNRIDSLTESNEKCKVELESKSMKLDSLDAELKELNSILTTKNKKIARLNISKKNSELQLTDQKNKIQETENNLKLCETEVEKLSNLESQVDLRKQTMDRLTTESNLSEECKNDLVDKSNKLKVCEVQLSKLNNNLIDKNESISKYNAKIQNVTEYQKTIELQFKESQAKLLKIEKDNQLCEAENDKLNRTLHNNIPLDCSSFESNPGIHSINLPGFGFFNVLCDNWVDGENWLVIIHRVFNGEESFNRDWATYREGFGSMQSEFFLGLEKIHRLTSSRRHELYVHLVAKDGSIYTARYDDFKISDEDSGYILNLGKWNAHDPITLSYHEGMKFTTFDRDNDMRGFNCASLTKYGWWHKACSFLE